MNATKTGKLARDMICDRLETHAEMEDPREKATKGLNNKLHKLVMRYGVKAVLTSIYESALDASELHEEMEDFDEPEDAIVSYRLQVFGRKIRAAMNTLD